MNNETRKIALAGMFIALGSILAVVFHSIGLGHVITPIHITVMIAGITLGFKYGIAVGLITPLLNSLLYSAPPLFPIAIGMSLELATYGGIIAIVYKYIKLFKNNLLNIYLSLLISMIAGRLIYGAYFGIISSLITYEFGFRIFINSVIITSLPGIVLQFLLVPATVYFIESKESK